MKLFLDTNIIIDLITVREPFGRDAGIIFQIGKSAGHELLVSDLSIFNTAYVLQKLHYAKDEIYDILTSLLPTLTITPVGGEIVESCLQRRGKDFEDDAQFLSAVNAGADFILTRNKKDFPEDDCVLAPREFFQLMNIVF